MGWIAILLLAGAVLVVVGAEWARLSPRIGGEALASRRRRKRKERLRVIEGAESDDFARSVERDLANLPTIGERDDRSRR